MCAIPTLVRIPGTALHAVVAGDEPIIQIRCMCDQRLADFHLPPDGTIARVAHRCAACKRVAEATLTLRPGYPAGHDGPWRCNGERCQHRYLGSVDAARGRLVLTCRRCRAEARITAATVACAVRVA
jgi:hypothetical protein